MRKIHCIQKQNMMAPVEEKRCIFQDLEKIIGYFSIKTFIVGAH